MNEILLSKPVLIGLHLGFAIAGIDAFFWFLGETLASQIHPLRMRLAALMGLFSFILSWIVGGYYYVKFYGLLVKPTIQQGLAPWAHSIAMEAKEHIFLFLVPLAGTLLAAAFIPEEFFDDKKIKRRIQLLALLVVVLGLSIGMMGFIISAAARWGIK